ncbi:DUF4123 domain-containing protein [Nannocystis punicea]|uniref:DUF4123 domain-containing protein n=1 Tax=Nannocystis punicea TaxID=2995304 RepID=A0ABY7GW73_9BACT|nr:DUF4123 domain-containing protein [Nannocystis poenicansa]WAS91223.1 DUF4123 domain-containing protein [Nannocystis poenicansa]
MGDTGTLATYAPGPWHRRPDHGALFAVYDAAAASEVLRELAGSGEPFVSLFQERGEPVLDEVAPHLVRLDPWRPWPQKVLDVAWGSAWAIFLHGPEDLQRVRKQLRRLLTVELPDARQVMFRFYDPQVLSAYLPTCTPAELGPFFGPIEAFYAFRAEGEVVDVFRRDAHGQLAVESRRGPAGA